MVGVKPDIEIRDYLIDDKDEILEGLLKIIGKEWVIREYVKIKWLQKMNEVQSVDY